MKTLKRYCLIIFFFVSIVFLFSPKSNAGALTLENLNIDAEINYDGSMNVKETWDIEIEETNTLYKSFETDITRYSNITDVTVYEVDGLDKKLFSQVQNWAYHVTKDCYYATYNTDGNFEIGWGVRLR